MDKRMSLNYSAALIDIADANPSFDIGKLRIAYTGKNRNGSFISKDSFVDAVPSMFGCPIVANYIREIDEIGSHDGEFIEKDGELCYVNMTEPIGFVPPGAEWGWEVVEDNNQIHQYIWTEVILWKRQEAYAKVKENGITSQSMEINVIDGEMCDDYYDIKKFFFEAFCLLGTAEPCFESAALFTFTNKMDFKESLDEMLKEFKLAFKANEKFQVKEGNSMDKLKELLEKYSVKKEDLTFDVDGLTDDELETKFGEVYDSVSTDVGMSMSPMDISTEDFMADEGEEFALASQIQEELYEQVYGAETLVDDWGTFARYFMQDYDTENNQVYFIDRTDWKLYGAPYVINGDEVTVDFTASKRMKYIIVEYKEGEKDVFSLKENITDIIKGIEDKHEEKYSALADKYNALAKDINEKAAKELFERFEDKLAGMVEFEALKTSKEVFDPTDLEEKLFALVGKKQFKFTSNNTKSTKPVKAPVLPANKDAQDSDKVDEFFNFLKK